MNENDPIDNDSAEDLAAEYAEEDKHFRAVLRHAVDVGTEMIDLILQEMKDTREAAKAAIPPAIPATPLSELLEAHDRISRAIRRAMLLARSLRLPVAAPRTAQGAARHAPDRTPEQAAEAAAKRAAARKQILRDVEDAIMRGAREPGDADQLQAELGDRLDSLDLEDEIGNRPIPDIIADICRDLGLGAQSGFRKWKRRTPQDIEILRTRAAAPPLPHDTSPIIPSSAAVTDPPLPRGEGRGEGVAASTATPPPDPGGTTFP